MGDAGRDLTLSLSRVCHVAASAQDARRKQEAAHHYYGRFDNVFKGPGIVENGVIKPLPHDQSVEDLAQSLIITTPGEMIDKLKPYQELGIDRVILNMNFGLQQQETIDSIQMFASEVMPHFARA